MYPSIMSDSLLERMNIPSSRVFKKKKEED